MACPAGEKKSLPSQFPGFNSIFIETNNIVNYLLKKERKVLINNIQAFSLKGSTCSCISPHKFITTGIGYRIVRESCLQSIWSLLITMALYFLKNVTLCIWLPPVSSKVSSPKFINKSNQRSISTTSSWAFVFLGQSVMCFFFFAWVINLLPVYIACWICCCLSASGFHRNDIALLSKASPHKLAQAQYLFKIFENNYYICGRNFPVVITHHMGTLKMTRQHIRAFWSSFHPI